MGRWRLCVEGLGEGVGEGVGGRGLGSKQGRGLTVRGQSLDDYGTNAALDVVAGFYTVKTFPCNPMEGNFK